MSLDIWPCCTKSLQSCPTPCDPMDCSPPGSSVHGIVQAGILEWVAIFFSRGSSWPRDWSHVSCIAGRFFTTEMPGEPIFSGKVGFLLSFTLNMLLSIILENLPKPRYEACWWKRDSEISVCLYQSILSLSLCIYAKQDDPPLEMSLPWSPPSSPCLHLLNNSYHART